MEKVIALILAMAICVALVSCGVSGTSNSNQSSDQTSLLQEESVLNEADEQEESVLNETDEIEALQAFADAFSSSGSYDSLDDMVEQFGLFSDYRLNGLGDKDYKIACTKEKASVISGSDFKSAGNYVHIRINLLHDNEIESVALHTDSDDIKPSGDYYDETLNGRGHADNGREEPDYLNVIGYVAIGSKESQEIEKSENYQDESLWSVPTYEQDKQFWNENGQLPHKTEVVVRKQILEHEGYGAYSGYLLVEKKDDKSQYFIDVGNFVTKPYWTYQSDLRTAALTGDYIAEYKQSSDYYPVNSGGEKVEIEDGTIVLVKGVTGTTGKIDRENNGIEALVWREWRKGYGGVECYFNTKDLTIVY